MLIGAMGAGKTSLGKMLAAELSRPFLDSDAVIEETEGSSGAEIAARLGVDRLHAIELETFGTMTRQRRCAVIAPAASVVDSMRGREILARHFVVVLVAPELVLTERRATGAHRRHLEGAEAQELERIRQPFWEALGDLYLDTSRGSPDALATEVAEKVRRHWGRG